MTQSLTPELTNRKPSPDDFEKPAIADLTNVIIDDREPVDNLISEKQRADQERKRVEYLEDILRSPGINF
ncbi:hypothetical protein [Dolichospermum circinale]|uniref:hypothetical protein n=1 Tax=Dolichospermum circinale TaxID=109265 RepID=UPI00040C2F37|nr:hypothetical protein [Dolichospermum circinale]MDB9482679.1 hypothetical protein [Dolichospermum circinale CS-537/05]MDB9452992.1 hypothetical protein [Dolichospermum circinale CS-541/06]MDB9461126.1 hypothetical protein [Dolichospermum circinale CS-541/04]MDB9475770.1 hypothetical protein [Dolichospermum circinale CS-537/11]MDB9479188.1 hypothetical protein [Dolichospermum circinale CS-537/03]